MKNLLSIIVLATCSMYAADSSAPKQNQQNWTSAKAIAKKHGNDTAVALMQLTDTKPNRIKKLKKIPPITLLKVAGLGFEKPLDEIFTLEQWIALRDNDVFPIIDKYRPESLSTWAKVDGGTEQTPAGKKRAKRSYVYPTLKTPRMLVVQAPTATADGYVHIVGKKSMDDIDLNSETIAAYSPHLQSIKVPASAQDLQCIPGAGQSKKRLVISYKEKGSENGAATTQTWKATRNSKNSDFGLSLKKEIARQVINANQSLLAESNFDEAKPTLDVGMAIFGVLRKYGVPGHELDKLVDNCASQTTDPAAHNQTVITLVQTHVPAAKMTDFGLEIQQCYEKAGLDISDESKANEQGKKMTDGLLQKIARAQKTPHSTLLKEHNSKNA